MIPKSVKRFPACAKPWRRPVALTDASAGVGRSEKIMLRQRAGAATRQRGERKRTALPSPHPPAHIRPMAKKPDSKTRKDPARPTRAKAAREPLAPIAPALEKLLNPGIAKGTAGVGSQTGLTAQSPAPKRAAEPLPGGERMKEKEPPTGLRPPASNSWDRREDFSAAHRARKSTREGAPVSPPPSSAGGGSATEGGRGGVNPSSHESPPPGSLRDPTSPLQGEVKGFAEAPQAQY